jgi:hypothetical protein
MESLLYSMISFPCLEGSWEEDESLSDNLFSSCFYSCWHFFSIFASYSCCCCWWSFSCSSLVALWTTDSISLLFESSVFLLYLSFLLFVVELMKLSWLKHLLSLDSSTTVWSWVVVANSIAASWLADKIGVPDCTTFPAPSPLVATMLEVGRPSDFLLEGFFPEKLKGYVSIH